MGMAGQGCVKMFYYADLNEFFIAFVECVP
jgi:hypothetical protein